MHIQLYFLVMSSSLLHWTRLIIGGLSIPLVFPLLVYNLYRYHFKNKIFRDRSLEDKVVLITGASSGLGEALSHAFHKAGCRVILAARRRDALEKVKEDLMTNYQSKHIPAVVTLDLHDLKTISERAQGTINIYGHIDILVNNGGISYRGEVSDTSLEVDLRVMVTNYFGPVALTKAILPSMIERNSGCIVAVSSVQGKIAIPFRSAYSASKHATQAFFDTLKSELSHTNIHVCVVSPGYVQTNLSLNAMTADGSKYGVMDKTTATGMDPKEAAESIIIATASKRTELVLAGMLPKLAILIRDLCPLLYFYLMGSRARRMRASNMIKQD
ncbi:dehydrogenase/reductase SDR family protein 7-like isoform X2 [Parasteatoda tepidariorum]|uniref:dehydrogenase/reductase SDR family protein 7-like isoform X2 n=1 Tax=Parasteatoda tepidariorum TaxID=114398 RepID=UPI001C720C4E|nr:dehydrogenase/reductase SDR family protein 7-like isoform X2 [Parasteatoda tepidariorum]